MRVTDVHEVLQCCISCLRGAYNEVFEECP